MMDCSHSMAEENTVGQTGGFSYTTPEKKINMRFVKMLIAASTGLHTLPHIGAREFLRKAGVHIIAHHDICCKFSPPMERISVQR